MRTKVTVSSARSLKTEPTVGRRVDPGDESKTGDIARVLIKNFRVSDSTTTRLVLGWLTSSYFRFRNNTLYFEKNQTCEKQNGGNGVREGYTKSTRFGDYLNVYTVQ